MEETRRRIRRVRRNQGLSMREAGEKLGWTKSKYRRFEVDGGISLDDLYHFCLVFSVPVSWIVHCEVTNKALERLAALETLQEEGRKLIEVIKSELLG